MPTAKRVTPFVLFFALWAGNFAQAVSLQDHFGGEHDLLSKTLQLSVERLAKGLLNSNLGDDDRKEIKDGIASSYRNCENKNNNVQVLVTSMIEGENYKSHYPNACYFLAVSLYEGLKTKNLYTLGSVDLQKHLIEELGNILFTKEVLGPQQKTIGDKSNNKRLVELSYASFAGTLLKNIFKLKSGLESGNFSEDLEKSAIEELAKSYRECNGQKINRALITNKYDKFPEIISSDCYYYGQTAYIGVTEDPEAPVDLAPILRRVLSDETVMGDKESGEGRMR